MGSRVDEVVRSLSAILAPGQVTELRAAGLAGETWVGWFDGADLPRLAAAALELEPKAGGVYFVPNPVRAPAAADLGQVVEHAAPPPAAEVLARKWLLLDVAPACRDADGRPAAAPCPPTDDEKRAAGAVLLQCRGGLEQLFGLTHAVVADGGDGWHLAYPVDLPDDDAARDLCRSLLALMASRAGSDRARVDVTAFDAARGWPLYGTLTKTGAESDGRPYRRSRVTEQPGHAPTDAVRAANTAAIRRALQTWELQEQRRAMPAPGSIARGVYQEVYARAALEREVGRVATAAPADRAKVLGESAVSLGQLVGGGSLARAAAEDGLYAATARFTDPPEQTQEAIRRGLDAGALSPRRPERPAPLNPPPAAPTPAASKNGKPAGPDGQKPAPEPPWKAKPNGPRPKGVTLAELEKMEFPPPQFVVEKIAGPGLNLLAGRPKSGKSRLALLIAWAVASGRPLDGLKVECGEVLYVALEDQYSRLKDRAAKLKEDLGWAMPDTLHLHTLWPRADEGGLHWVYDWVEEHKESAKLVIIDVLQRFRKPAKGNASSYADDYEAVGGLKDLVDHYKIAGMFLHHTRKARAQDPFDELSGTYGISGPADTLCMLESEGGEGKLYIRGRDVPESTISLTYTPRSGRWVVSGVAEGVDQEDRMAEPERKPRASPAREACIAWLKKTLAGNSRILASVVDEAKEAGHAEGTIFRSIKACKEIEQFDDIDGKRTQRGTFLQWLRLKSDSAAAVE